MKYLFPEIIISNRWTHDEKKGYIDELNYAFVFGMIFDVSIFRGRMGGMKNQPNYAEHIKRLIDLKKRYRQFFYTPSFSYDPKLLQVPHGITAARYQTKDGILFVCMNETSQDISFDYNCFPVTVAAHDVSCTLISAIPAASDNLLQS